VGTVVVANLLTGLVVGSGGRFRLTYGNADFAVSFMIVHPGMNVKNPVGSG
jgi:hypothetical protein